MGHRLEITLKSRLARRIDIWFDVNCGWFWFFFRRFCSQIDKVYELGSFDPGIVCIFVLGNVSLLFGFFFDRFRLLWLLLCEWVKSWGRGLLILLTWCWHEVESRLNWRSCILRGLWFRSRCGLAEIESGKHCSRCSTWLLLLSRRYISKKISDVFRRWLLCCFRSRLSGAGTYSQVKKISCLLLGSRCCVWATLHEIECKLLLCRLARCGLLLSSGSGSRLCRST